MPHHETLDGGFDKDGMYRNMMYDCIYITLHLRHSFFDMQNKSLNMAFVQLAL